MANGPNNNAVQPIDPLEAVDRMIKDMEIAEYQAMQAGLKPWEYNLSAKTREVTENRTAEDQRLASLQQQQPGGTLPEAQQPLSKPGMPVEPVEGGPGKAYEGVRPEPQQPLEQRSTTTAQDIDFGAFPDIYKSTKDIDYWTDTRLGRQHTTSGFIPRQLNGTEIKILKEDDWIKNQPWAQTTTDTQGKTVYYTTNLNLPRGVYRPDIIQEYPQQGRGAATFEYSSDIGLSRNVPQAVGTMQMIR